MYQTLLQSERRVDDPNKADIIFVYDYCRLMWALSEEHAEHHWWASENLKKKLTGTGGPALVSAYNVMTQVSEDTKFLAVIMNTLLPWPAGGGIYTEHRAHGCLCLAWIWRVHQAVALGSLYMQFACRQTLPLGRKSFIIP